MHSQPQAPPECNVFRGDPRATRQLDKVFIFVLGSIAGIKGSSGSLCFLRGEKKSRFSTGSWVLIFIFIFNIIVFQGMDHIFVLAQGLGRHLLGRSHEIENTIALTVNADLSHKNHASRFVSAP